MMEVRHLADKASVIIQTCIGKIRSGGDDFAVQTISPVLIEELFDTLKRFKSELLNTDERIIEFFKESRFQWARTLPTGEDNFESYYKKHFDETDHEEKLLYSTCCKWIYF